MNKDDDKTQTHFVLRKGTVVSHYRIIEKIGAGGMGEVYLAEDTKLKRQVALKFLPAQFVTDKDLKARFTREAQAAAKLDHPNIVPVYEVTEHQGRPFFAMAHIEGQSLRNVIKQDKLTIGEAIDLALQVCEGLQEAHEAGVVHRDIKPSNIILDKKGRPKLVDFGLATIQGSEELTKTGSTLGTIGYMSPEQVQTKDVDQRSDLFSFGLVLYELIAGRTPFKRESEAATLQAIVQDAPEPLARYKTDVPDELQRIVSKSLEKDPALRYQSAAGVISDLKRLKISGISEPPAKPKKPDKRKMLVVLPFENLGPAEDEYFADGMTEEIISRLTAIRNLGVISRTSAMQYKHSTKSIKEIGSDLGVEYVLEGTVRWNRKDPQASRVRITPQLIRVADDTHLWSERYDRTLDDIFVVQSDIAGHVIEQLNIQLLEPERRALEAKPTANLDAYHAYLRGLEYAGRPDYSEEDFHQAVQMLECAVELDPEFAVAHADLSRAHSAMYFHGHDRTDERLLQAKAAVDRALELQPGSAEVHLALGYYHYWCRQEYETALKEFAIAQNDLPNDARIFAVVAAVLKRHGKFDQTIEYYKKAFELSPRDAGLPHEIGCAYMTIRRYAEAERFYDLSISLAPDQVFAYVCKAWNCWLWRGDIQGGRTTLDAMPRKIGSTLPRPAAALFEWFRLEQFAGNYTEALDVLKYVSFVFDGGQWWFTPKDLLAAYTCQLIDDPARARSLYRSALRLLEKEVKERPDDDRVHSSLGIAYAGLGRRDEGIREGKLAVELIPVSKNSVIGPFRVEDLAFAYTLLGEFDDAVDQIEYLLSIPCWLSVPLLHLDPRWDPLRDHPRFKALLEKYEKVHGT